MPQYERKKIYFMWQKNSNQIVSKNELRIDYKNNSFDYQNKKQNKSNEFIFDDKTLNYHYSMFLKFKILLIHLFILFVVLI